MYEHSICDFASKHIGVQPTALARRKMALGGKRQLTLGRPPKAISTDHTKERGTNFSGQVMPKRKPKAPHNLKKCVKENMQLGKNHSAK